MRWGALSDFSLAFDPLLIAKLVHKVGVMFWKLFNLQYSQEAWRKI